MLSLKVTEDVSLETLNISDSQELFNCIEVNRVYLKAWLPWLDHNQNVYDSESFIRSTLEERKKNESLVLAIKLRGNIVGTSGLVSINPSKNYAEIGYWLAECHQGKGIATASTKSLIDYVNMNLGIRNFGISVNIMNLRSKRIPERLGFRFAEKIEDAEWLYDHYVDHLKYLLNL